MTIISVTHREAARGDVRARLALDAWDRLPELTGPLESGQPYPDPAVILTEQRRQTEEWLNAIPAATPARLLFALGHAALEAVRRVRCDLSASDATLQGKCAYPDDPSKWARCVFSRTYHLLGALARLDAIAIRMHNLRLQTTDDPEMRDIRRLIDESRHVRPDGAEALWQGVVVDENDLRRHAIDAVLSAVQIVRTALPTLAIDILGRRVKLPRDQEYWWADTATRPDRVATRACRSNQEIDVLPDGLLIYTASRLIALGYGVLPESHLSHTKLAEWLNIEHRIIERELPEEGLWVEKSSVPTHVVAKLDAEKLRQRKKLKHSLNMTTKDVKECLRKYLYAAITKAQGGTPSRPPPRSFPAPTRTQIRSDGALHAIYVDLVVAWAKHEYERDIGR